MAHITVPQELPGIRGLMAFRPETAIHLNHLAEAILRSPSTLTVGERELMATFVSFLNGCHYCQNAHGSLAQHYLNWDNETMDQFKADYLSSDISDKLKSLLSIAASTQQSGKSVSQQQVDEARSKGATDREIHDTVLITAAFCMFNRYVDGLGTEAPLEREFYLGRAKVRAEEGYSNYDPLR